MGDDELNVRQGADELFGEFGSFGGDMNGTGDVEGQQIDLEIGTDKRSADGSRKPALPGSMNAASPEGAKMALQGAASSSCSSKLETQTDTTARQALSDMTDFEDQDVDFGEIWQRILVRLRAELGEDVFTSWFLRVELEAVSGGVVTLSAATRFLRNWIMSHFKETLIGFWADEIGTVHKLDVRVRSNLHVQAPDSGLKADNTQASGHNGAQAGPRSGQSASARRLADMRINPTHVGDQRGTRFETGARPFKAGKPSGSASGVQKGPAGSSVTGNSLSLVQTLSSALDRRYVFDSFCAGAANKVAFEAARAVAMALPGAPVLYNPLYLHGSVGLGKTHLLQAIANQAASTGTRQVVYLTAERFMSNFVQALRSERALQFKEQLRAIDLLLIDDMQFLTGKAIQQEFCHMLNALIDGGKQVVVAADRPASELDALEERVRSRLQGGAAVQIDTPDTQLRRDILARRCQIVRANHPGMEISDTVLDYVANLITTNGRDLDGALNRLICHAQTSREPVTIAVAEKALSDLLGSREPRKVRIEDIQKIVSQHYNVSRTDMLSARRTRTIVLPRQIAMYIAKNVTPRSLPEIGRRFGNRDHTTVLHAVRKIEGLLQTDKKLSQEIELLRRLVEE